MLNDAAAYRFRTTPASKLLGDLVDDSLTLTITRLKGISGLHYATSYPGRKPKHALEPAGAGGRFTTTQLFAHRNLFTCIPRPTEADFALGYDKPGRHAPPIERAVYSMSTMLGLVNEVLRTDRSLA